MTPEQQLGVKIREIRTIKRLTLSQLSALAGISVSTLSKIENAKVSSPLAVYAKIASALQIPLGQLFSDDGPVPISVVRKEEWRTYIRVSNYIGKAIAFNKSNKKMEPFVHIYHPKVATPPVFQHNSEELIFVLKGKVEFRYGDTHYVLKPGDCVYFDANVTHSTRALGGTPAKALVVQA